MAEEEKKGMEEKEEDIIKKLEELRKKPRIEEAKKEVAVVEDEEARRRRRARIIGSLVVIIVVLGIFFVGYKTIISPLSKEKAKTVQQTKAPEATKAPEEKGLISEVAYKRELDKTKQEKIDHANSLLSGLPPEFNSLKSDLINTINSKTRIEEVKSIDVEAIATEIWREARKREVDAKQSVGEVVIAYLYHNSSPDYEIIKGAENIKKMIDVLDISKLKSLEIVVTSYDYIPIRLPRDRIGGFVMEGDEVNIYYRELLPDKNVTIRPLVKDGKVIKIMRALSSGTITLSESEQKLDTGGGAEGKGTVPSLSIGGLGSITSEQGFGASVGYKMRQSSVSYSVNLEEIKKAAAAGKISEEELAQTLEKYGIKLTEKDIKLGFGDFDEEFLILVEATEEESKNLVSKLVDPKDRENIFITISAKPKAVAVE